MMSLRRALLWILFSVVAVSGTATVGWTFYRYRLKGRSGDDRYQLKVVIQRAGTLPTNYLVEQLGLSVDCPVNLFALNLKESVERLAESPVIRSVRLSRQLPDGLLVDYEAREPVAQLFDYTNTLIDQEGALFPMRPFFTPKRLPEVVLGDDPRAMEVALGVLNVLLRSPFAEELRVRRVDVSSAFAESYGRREVVVILEDSLFKESGGKTLLHLYPRMLRLGVSEYQGALYNYLVLRKELLDRNRLEPPAARDELVVECAPTVVDLRLPDLAFFEVVCE